ncbi:MAG: hypothetical protein QM610_01305 [Chitinophagaceae bacterium]
MKKLLFILMMGLLFCNQSHAKQGKSKNNIVAGYLQKTKRYKELPAYIAVKNIYQLCEDGSTIVVGLVVISLDEAGNVLSSGVINYPGDHSCPTAA